MKLTAILATLLSTVVAAGELQIIKTHEVPAELCERKSKVGDTLSMHYRGTLEDGTEFDKSYGRGPFTFPLGAGRVIKGWDQGLVDMCIGEKRKLVIPYDLAYGERGMGPIPPKATLVFETELLEIKGYTPPKREERVVEEEKKEKDEL